MKIITKPSVFVVGRQSVDYPAVSEFLGSESIPDWATDSERAAEVLPEVAGRLCYMSFKRPRPGGNRAYLGHIVESGHGSVLEHAVFNLIVTGVSRSLTHELVRHRVGFSYSQLSQRFVDESDVSFVVPPALLGGKARFGASAGDTLSDAYAEWLAAVAYALARYNDVRSMLQTATADTKDSTSRRKAVLEAARSVLPNCTETKIFVTSNVRALRHFVELRASDGADAEIRRLALAVLMTMTVEAPALFSDYSVAGGAVTTTYPKV